MDTVATELYGECACQRNQYTIIIPSHSTSLAQVFFDNSIHNPTPVTAWLRVPLDFYRSTTYSFFPDETHSSIKRTFHTPAPHPALSSTRRQFCGYCGTHLTAWNEGRDREADFIDVTLGSLLHESIEQLEALRIVTDDGEGEGEEEERREDGLVKGGSVDVEDHVPIHQDGLIKGGSIDEEDHVPTNENKMGGVEGPAATRAPVPYSASVAARHMQNRGMPYFEELVEHSRLGRIKRQKGGFASQDGGTTVEWQIVEIGGDDDDDDGDETVPQEPIIPERANKRHKSK